MNRHIAFDGRGWVKLSQSWTKNAQITEENIMPESGDTFSDVTSRPGATYDLRNRGLKVKLIRIGMWGRDMRIE